MIRILKRLGYTFYFQSYILFYFILKIQAKKHQFTTNLIINYFYNNNVIVDKNYYEASKKKPIINIFSLLLLLFFFSLKHCSCIPKKKIPYAYLINFIVLSFHMHTHLLQHKIKILIIFQQYMMRLSSLKMRKLNLHIISFRKP